MLSYPKKKRVGEGFPTFPNSTLTEVKALIFLNMKIFWLIHLLSFSSLIGISSLHFLWIWPDAKITSMAGVSVAVVDNYSHINPGVLPFHKKGIGYTYNNFLPGLWPSMFYHRLYGALPIGENKVLGLDISYFTEGVTEVINPQGNVLGKYREYNLSLSISYGFKMRDKIGMGGAIKYIQLRHYRHWRDPIWYRFPSGHTFGFDFGTFYRPFSFLGLGLCINNLGPGLQDIAGGKPHPLPRIIRLGIGFEQGFSKSFGITLSAELSNPIIDTGDFLSYIWKGLGIEVRLYDFLYLRGGAFENEEDEVGGMTYGFGLKIKRLQIDLGFDEKIWPFRTNNWKLTLSYNS